MLELMFTQETLDPKFRQTKIAAVVVQRLVYITGRSSTRIPAVRVQRLIKATP